MNNVQSCCGSNSGGLLMKEAAVAVRCWGQRVYRFLLRCIFN